MEDNPLNKTLGAISLFAIAMGFLEAAVVVYLRLHFYPKGFAFPLVVIPEDILIVEILRELATIVMLVVVGWLTGRGFLSRFAYFAIAFGIWDIFYYVFLKLTVDWPASLLTDDILFLIPLPWVGPVLAPILVSVSLIAAGLVVLLRDFVGRPVHLTALRWTFIALGGILTLASFLENSIAAIQQQPLEPFSWLLFASGLLVGGLSFIAALKVPKTGKPTLFLNGRAGFPFMPSGEQGESYFCSFFSILFSTFSPFFSTF